VLLNVCNNQNMLDLDSPKWKQLKQAYGSAEDIPTLLRQLSDAPAKMEDYETEPWFSLWSSLCHQNDVYTASYAAVPHIVANATLRPPEERREFVLLVALIEVWRYRSDSPEIPSDLEQDYFSALEEMRLLICECLRLKLKNEDDAKVLLGGLAVVDGLHDFGMATIELPEPNACPNCGTYVSPLGYKADGFDAKVAQNQDFCIKTKAD
jgi:hypothetical protein